MTTPTPAAARPTGATYRQTLARYEADPTQPAHVRALGWLYADLLKEASHTGDAARMLRGLHLIAPFPMPEADVRWRDAVLWSVGRFLLRQAPETLPFPALAELVQLAGGFVPAEPGLLRSVWWKALLRHATTGLDWHTLADQYGWEGGFRPEDEQSQPYGDGKTAPALLESLLYAVAKQLLSRVLLDEAVGNQWLGRLAACRAAHPTWTFLAYYEARLLLRLDRPDEAMAVFLPFARQKTGEFWVWTLLAELVPPGQRLACYARALCCSAPETFLVRTRQHAARTLLLHNRWADARAEIEQLVRTRQQQDWPVPAEVTAWQADARYGSAEASAPGAWCRALAPEADALLWADLPEAVGLVTGYDPTGKRVQVAITDRLTGRIAVQKLASAPAVGTHLAVRYQITASQPVGAQLIQARPTDAPLTHLTLETVTGPLRRGAGKPIGFVRDVYVPAEVLSASPVGTDELVRVEAYAAWDAVKQKTGRRALRIERVVVNL